MDMDSNQPKSEEGLELDQGHGKGQGGEERDSLFWNELYWFFIVGLGAWIIMSLVLPQKTVETLKLLSREKEVIAELEGAQWQEQARIEAIEAMENDPFYQEAIYREVARVKRVFEEYLEPPPSSSPVTTIGF